ncbi:helix-turn-helix domain-containing protein [Sulfurimonas sp. NW9]|uniref:helix-turn-helix domain-containing protein n=1 Tax=Sulfurimonas sp. NW9 TaxID=2922728 RepID=UPI003DA9CECD
MTKEELAKLLGTTRQNLNKWEKERPDLVRLINQGLALDLSIEETRKHLERLEAIKENASSGKFNLK